MNVSVLLDKLKERLKEYISVSETLKLMSQANENCPLDHVKTYLLSSDIHYHMPVFYLDDYFRIAIDPSEESIRNFDGYGSTHHELTNDKVSDNAYFLIESLNDFEPIQEFDIFAYKRGYDYIANHSVGKFTTGEKVIGLTEDRAIELLKTGAIKKRQINNENVVRQSKAPPPPNHINIAPTSQKIIDEVIETEKREEAIAPNNYQRITMLCDYLTPHQAACLIAGLHPEFNGSDDGLEMALGVIYGGIKKGSLILDDDEQIKGDDLKVFLHSKNWIMKEFNDNLPNDVDKMPSPTVKQTEPPNNDQLIKELKAANVKIDDLMSQLAQAKVELIDISANNQKTENQGDSLLILGAVMHCIKDAAKRNFTQDLLTQTILDKYKNVSGLSKSTLDKKYSEAKTYIKQRNTS